MESEKKSKIIFFSIIGIIIAALIIFIIVRNKQIVEADRKAWKSTEEYKEIQESEKRLQEINDSNKKILEKLEELNDKYNINFED